MKCIFSKNERHAQNQLIASKREYHSSVSCHQHSSSDTKASPPRSPEGETENIFSQLMGSGQDSCVPFLHFLAEYLPRPHLPNTAYSP